MDFSQFLSFKYFFGLKVGPLSPAMQKILIIVWAVCLVLAGLAYLLAYWQKKQPPLAKLFNKIFLFWLINGLAGFVWLFFRAEAVPLLGARFWILFLVLIDLVWLFYIIKYAIKQLPQEKKDLAAKKQFAKYLPK